MNKRNLLIVLLIITIFIITGCSSNTENLENTNNQENTESEFNQTMEKVSAIKVKINEEIYEVALEDNATAESFVKLLPLELHMNELNNNEKYFYLDETLPTNSYNPKHIEAGDVMLYGNNCIVVFYKSFDTSYSYTKIGHISNMPSLNNKDIIIEFEK